MEIPWSQIALTTKDGLAGAPCSERVRMQSVWQQYSQQLQITSAKEST